MKTNIIYKASFQWRLPWKSNATDILTEFRGRSDEIRVHPLSFAEFYSVVGGDKEEAFENGAFFGGMPLVLSRPTDNAKMSYLESLFSEVYLKDIVDRKHIKREDIDFIANNGGKRTYIQSAYAMSTGEKATAETNPLL